MNEDIERLRAYFATGATRTYSARKENLRRLYSSILLHQTLIAQALKEDLGKSEAEAYMSEMGMALHEIKYTLKHLRKWMRAQRPFTPLSIFPARQRILYEPYGVVLILAPWNYPFLLSLSPLIGALGAGNCCVIKPSEMAPATSRVLRQLLAEALPTGLITVVEGGIAESQALLEEKFDYIFYTGNGRVGRYVMEKASQHLTPLSLELGGKSPVIVARSASLRLAARRIVFGKFLNCGQTCIAPDYILVEELIHDELVQYLVEAIKEMYGSNPLENPDYGKIINRKHYKRLCGLMDQNKVRFGGDKDESQGRIAPTLLTGVLPDDPIMQEEIFGPLLPIIKVENIETAIHFVQRREHPLAVYLFANDRAVEEFVMREISFGGGCVNDVISHIVSPNLPFGGVGASGFGAYHGQTSFTTFSHKKAIVRRATWCDPSLRYPPYTPKKLRWLKRFL